MYSQISGKIPMRVVILNLNVTKSMVVAKVDKNQTKHYSSHNEMCVGWCVCVVKLVFYLLTGHLYGVSILSIHYQIKPFTRCYLLWYL